MVFSWSGTRIRVWRLDFQTFKNKGHPNGHEWSWSDYGDERYLAASAVGPGEPASAPGRAELDRASAVSGPLSVTARYGADRPWTHTAAREKGRGIGREKGRGIGGRGGTVVGERWEEGDGKARG